MKRVPVLFLCLYVLWGIALVYSHLKTGNLVLFAYLTLFQFFVPGMILGASFGLLNRPLTEIILYSFILSYLIFLLASLPTQFLHMEWPFFIGVNVFLYLLVLAIFLVKSHQGLSYGFKKPEVQELCVLALGIFVFLSYSYINYRSDATFYNHYVSASLESKYVDNAGYDWKLTDDGNLSKEWIKIFYLDYVQYFNFISLPLRWSSFDQRYGWLIYHKLFIFLSIISVYCLGRRLLNPACGHLSLLFYFVTVFPLGAYYYYRTGEVGLMFLQSAHPKSVTQNVFLLAFYLTVITAFKNQSRKYFLFAGAILLCMFSIHYLSAVYAVLNFIAFQHGSLCLIVHMKQGIYIPSLPGL